MRTLILISALVLFSGCQLIDGPSPMPTGYKYHQKPYHSKPGPEPHHDANAKDVGHTHQAETPYVEPAPLGNTPVTFQPQHTQSDYNE
jgi:hypothetical protein